MIRFVEILTASGANPWAVYSSPKKNLHAGYMISESMFRMKYAEVKR